MANFRPEEFGSGSLPAIQPFGKCLLRRRLVSEIQNNGIDRSANVSTPPGVTHSFIGGTIAVIQALNVRSLPNNAPAVLSPETASFEPA
jgi:hypothetical protein